jgi:hypothetical protein
LLVILVASLALGTKNMLIPIVGVQAMAQNPAALLKHSYVPLVAKHSSSSLPHLLGWIGQGYWDLNSPTDLNNLLVNADTWAGKKASISAIFFDINGGNPDYNLKGQLEALWQKGYTPFFNLMGGGKSAYDFAIDQTDMTAIAKTYAAWVHQGGNRRAFVAPLPEMNGYWPTYHEDPANFKIAFDNLRSTFAAQGVTSSQVWWVFAPNGWSRTGDEFEKYYPGDSKVDIVAFSSYNYGYCSVAIPYQKWETSPGLYQTYIQRMRTLAPTKPIIIAQTATTGQYNTSSINHAQKDQWLIDTYNYLASQDGVLAVMYYDFNNSSWECDWTIFNTPSGVAKFDGYKTAAANSSFSYVAPSTLSSMSLTVP